MANKERVGLLINLVRLGLLKKQLIQLLEMAIQPIGLL